MSDFRTLNTALSGLIAHRRALDVIGHNITNAATDGYSRRRVDLTTAGTGPQPATWSKSFRAGEGVEVADVVRIRDEYLESRAQREHGLSWSLSSSATLLTNIETLFQEPGDLGLAAQLGEMWGAWDDAANDPASIPARAALLERASTVATTLRRAAADLTDQRTNLVAGVRVRVNDVNATASRIAELNHAIVAAEASGVDAHDLSDERDLAVLKLGDLIGAVARPGEFGTMDVFLGGSPLVRGDRSYGINLATGGALDPPYNTLPLQDVEIQWSSGGYPALLGGGEVSGMMNGIDDTIPRFLTDLNNLASTLVSQVNAIHLTGQGLDTVNDVNLTFFDPAGTTADTIALSADVAGQPSRVAVAAAGAGQLDASVGQQMAALHSSGNGIDALYQSFIGRIGVEVQTAQRRAGIQGEISRQADDQRTSVSGVNIDEEMISLVQTQRAYEASARLMTAVDEMLDTLINRTGLIGR